MYLKHALRVQRQLLRFWERLSAPSEQVLPGAWQAALGLRESTPRPHARPAKQVVREERRHLGGS